MEIVEKITHEIKQRWSISGKYRFLPHTYQNKIQVGLPWWHSGWGSACQCRVHGFEPWSGKIPHAAEQLSPCATTTEPALQSPRATTTEPACLESMLRNKRSHHNEKPAHSNEKQPPLAAASESLRAATKTQRSQK